MARGMVSRLHPRGTDRDMAATRDQISTDITAGVVYQTFGAVPTSARSLAEELMASLSEVAPRTVISANVKVKHDESRPPDQPCLAQATLNMQGATVRAQAAAASASDALRVIGDKLERRLARLAERRRRARQRPPSSTSGAPRSSELDSGRPEFRHRPADERAVVRRKTYPPTDRTSIGEAMFDLDMMDFRFYVFTDRADDKTSIVYETGDIGLAIRKVDGSRPHDGTARADIEVSETPAPVISLAEAVSYLNKSEKAFIFFCDTDRDHPSVLYRRYDGHYGLVVPSAA